MRRAYRRATGRAGGTWHSVLSLAAPGAPPTLVLADRADDVVAAASVNKLAVACAVLDKVDRGELALDRTVELTADTVLAGHGVYHHQPVWGDRLTLANILAALLVVSDNTAVRLCGTVCPGPEVNGFLAARGLRHTRVQPAPGDPRRMWLGTTTARESHDLLSRLAAGDLLAPASTAFVLRLLRAPEGFQDGVRRDLTGAERARTASKFGADEDSRHEVGVMVDRAGRPAAVFAFLAALPAHRDDYGPTNPLVRARAGLGRRLCDEVARLPG